MMKFGKFHQMIRQEKKNRKQSWFHLLPGLIKESTRRRYKKIDYCALDNYLLFVGVGLVGRVIIK